jgi:hypothetical protein
MLSLRTLTRTSALAALALASAPALLAAQRFALRGDRAAFHNLAGEVTIESGSGSEVVVTVERRGADADELRVERADVDGADAVRVVYPGDRIVYPRLGGRGQTTVNLDGEGGSRGWSWGWGRGRRITVVGSGRGTEAYADARIQVPAGRSVTVNQAVGRVTVTNVDGRLTVKTASARVEATGTRGFLDIDVGSGGVAVTNAEGELKVDTGSGGVRVSGIRGSSALIDTGSGGVTGSGIRVRELKVDVGSGGVDLADVAADDVVVDTGSGSVALSLTRDADHVRIDTGSGGVTLAVPDGFGAMLEVDTGSGGISVDVPVEARRASRSHLTGRLGDGRGQVVIDTGSGGVRIRRR